MQFIAPIGSLQCREAFPLTWVSGLHALPPIAPQLMRPRLRGDRPSAREVEIAVRLSSKRCWSHLWRFAGIVAVQQEPKHKSVRDQKQRYYDSYNEIGGAQLTRDKPNRVALIEGVEKIGSAPKIEAPDQDHAQLAAQPGQCQQGQHRGNEVTVCSWACESGRQLRRNNAGHQECQPDEPEAVQDEKRAQGIDPRFVAQVRPNVLRSDDAPGEETEGDAHSE